jgi:hypothetical protein
LLILLLRDTCLHQSFAIHMKAIIARLIDCFNKLSKEIKKVLIKSETIK